MVVSSRIAEDYRVDRALSAKTSSCQSGTHNLEANAFENRAVVARAVIAIASLSTLRYKLLSFDTNSMTFWTSTPTSLDLSYTSLGYFFTLITNITRSVSSENVKRFNLRGLLPQPHDLVRTVHSEFTRAPRAVQLGIGSAQLLEHRMLLAQ